MDSIKKKMEKLSNETREAEHRIAHYEGIKAANEAEAEKFEEQLRGVQKKIQALESQYDVCTEVRPGTLLLETNLTECSDITTQSMWEKSLIGCRGRVLVIH